MGKEKPSHDGSDSDENEQAGDDYKNTRRRFRRIALLLSWARVVVVTYTN